MVSTLTSGVLQPRLCPDVGRLEQPLAKQVQDTVALGSHCRQWHARLVIQRHCGW